MDRFGACVCAGRDERYPITRDTSDATEVSERADNINSEYVCTSLLTPGIL